MGKCTKGWEGRCPASQGPRCACACGGDNHGTEKNKKQIKAELDGGISETEFFKNDRRRTSMEMDFGVWWRGPSAWPTYRISWIERTGEIYAISHPGGTIRVLGKIKGKDRIEKLLTGWAEICGQKNSLDWVKSKI